MADANHSMELKVSNKSAEDFTVYDSLLDEDTARWIDGEAPVAGQTLKRGSSITWGVVGLNPNCAPWGEVRLASPDKSLIGFKFQTHTTGMSTVLVELCPKINYQVPPTAIGQTAVKAQVYLTTAS